MFGKEGNNCKRPLRMGFAAVLFLMCEHVYSQKPFIAYRRQTQRLPSDTAVMDNVSKVQQHVSLQEVPRDLKKGGKKKKKKKTASNPATKYTTNWVLITQESSQQSPKLTYGKKTPRPTVRQSPKPTFDIKKTPLPSPKPTKKQKTPKPTTKSTPRPQSEQTPTNNREETSKPTANPTRRPTQTKTTARPTTRPTGETTAPSQPPTISPTDTLTREPSSPPFSAPSEQTSPQPSPISASPGTMAPSASTFVDQALRYMCSGIPEESETSSSTLNVSYAMHLQAESDPRLVLHELDDKLRGTLSIYVCAFGSSAARRFQNRPSFHSVLFPSSPSFAPAPCTISFVRTEECYLVSTSFGVTYAGASVPDSSLVNHFAPYFLKEMSEVGGLENSHPNITDLVYQGFVNTDKGGLDTSGEGQDNDSTGSNGMSNALRAVLGTLTGLGVVIVGGGLLFLYRKKENASRVVLGSGDESRIMQDTGPDSDIVIQHVVFDWSLDDVSSVSDSAFEPAPNRGVLI